MPKRNVVPRPRGHVRLAHVSLVRTAQSLPMVSFLRPCDRNLPCASPRQRLCSLPSSLRNVPLQLRLFSAISLQYEGELGDL